MRDVPEALARAEALLLAPGAPFEIEDGIVFGERMQVFKNRARSIRALLERSVSFGDAEYLVTTDGRRFTYAEHAARVAALASVLHRRFGVNKSDRVALLAANGPEWVITFFATIGLGAVAVGMNAWWTGPEIARALDVVEPKVLFVDRRRAERLADLDIGAEVVVFEDTFDALVAEHRGAALPDAAIAEDDPAIMLFSSGTSGDRPRAAVHSHGNVTNLVMVGFFHGARTHAVSPPAPGKDGKPLSPCVLVTSPLFHVSGLHCAAITTLASGAKSVWTIGRFDPETVLRAIEAERVTGWGYTATMLRRVLTHPRAGDHDLSSLRMIGGGGSPIPELLQRRARELAPTIATTMGVGYGLTEACAFTTLNPGPELVAHPTSAGRPVPTVSIEIRDEHGHTLPFGEEGEVYVRGPLVMREYFRDPDATARAIGEGRWLRTGDVGVFDGTRLTLASRKRDLILRGGENVHPPEIEARLEAHPDVAEAAIVGVAHPDLGQEVKAFVVRKPGRAPSPDALRAWVADTLAYYKVPSAWRIQDTPLPRNATGKVLKHVLAGDAESRFVEE